MSDQIVESKASPEQKKLAEERGWIPDTRYKGDPEKFIDADSFLEKTETLLPFIKKQLQSSRAEADELRRTNAELKATVDEVRASVEEIEERYTVETQKRVEAARKDLKSAIREAAEAEDLKLVVKLTEELDTLDDAVKEAKTEKKEEKKDPPDTKGDLSEAQKAALKETNDWISEHPWYQTDRKRRALFNSYASDMKLEGDKRVGREFYDAVLAEVEKDFDEGGRSSSKVEGGKGSGGNSGGGKTGYAALPADAKAACDADAKRFVGTKKYPKLEDWQKRYAELYFQGEAK